MQINYLCNLSLVYVVSPPGINPKLQLIFYYCKLICHLFYHCRRHLKAGSKETFVAPIKSDLGALKSIDVSHMNPLNLLDSWRLDKVTVEFVDTGER